MMTQFDQDTFDPETFDDVSFYIGEEEEGFCESTSVCDSELSLTDGESDGSDDDDGSSFWSDNASEISLDESLKHVLDEASFEELLLGEVFVPIKGEDEPHASERSNKEGDGNNEENECVKQISDDTVETKLTASCSQEDSHEYELRGAFCVNNRENVCLKQSFVTAETKLTASCSEEDSLEYEGSYLREEELRKSFCPQEYIYHQETHPLKDIDHDDDLFDMPVLTDAQDKLCVDEIMAKASSMMVDDDVFEDEEDNDKGSFDLSELAKECANLTTDEIVANASSIMANNDSDAEEDYGFISREILDEVLFNPIKLSASLKIMTRLSKIDKKKKHSCDENYDDVPTIEA